MNGQPVGKKLLRFETWLRENRAISPATSTMYLYAVRRALRVVGEDHLSTARLDAYFAGLSPGPRNVARSAWRAFVAFGASQGVEVPNGSPGQLGRPLVRFSEGVAPENFALAYLARAIDLPRFGDLRWTDVEWTGGADATITDPDVRKRYHVHRRPLEVLLRWARPDGVPKGALAPNAPGGSKWIDREVLTEKIEAARDAVFSGAPPHPDIAFILALPPPRVESYAPSLKTSRIDSGAEEA